MHITRRWRLSFSLAVACPGKHYVARLRPRPCSRRDTATRTFHDDHACFELLQIGGGSWGRFQSCQLRHVRRRTDLAVPWIGCSGAGVAKAPPGRSPAFDLVRAQVFTVSSAFGCSDAIVVLGFYVRHFVQSHKKLFAATAGGSLLQPAP